MGFLRLVSWIVIFSFFASQARADSFTKVLEDLNTFSMEIRGKFVDFQTQLEWELGSLVSRESRVSSSLKYVCLLAVVSSVCFLGYGMLTGVRDGVLSDRFDWPEQKFWGFTTDELFITKNLQKFYNYSRNNQGFLPLISKPFGFMAKGISFIINPVERVGCLVSNAIIDTGYAASYGIFHTTLHPIETWKKISSFVSAKENFTNRIIVFGAKGSKEKRVVIVAEGLASLSKHDLRILRKKIRPFAKDFTDQGITLVIRPS